MHVSRQRWSVVLGAAVAASALGGGLVLAQGGAAGGDDAKSAAAAPASGTFTIDPAHTSVVFKIRHANISDVWGRFNKVEGQVKLDAQNAASSSFNVTLGADSVDTGQKQRDDHLRNDDFFDAKQFPTITFKSTSVKQSQSGFDVTGDLTMHGKTKPVTIPLRGGSLIEFPKDTQRTGFTGELKINRQDWGVGNPKFEGVLGNEVTIMLGVEATNKK